MDGFQDHKDSYFAKYIALLNAAHDFAVKNKNVGRFNTIDACQLALNKLTICKKRNVFNAQFGRTFKCANHTRIFRHIIRRSAYGLSVFADFFALGVTN